MLHSLWSLRDSGWQTFCHLYVTSKDPLGVDTLIGIWEKECMGSVNGPDLEEWHTSTHIPLSGTHSRDHTYCKGGWEIYSSCSSTSDEQVSSQLIWPKAWIGVLPKHLLPWEVVCLGCLPPSPVWPALGLLATVLEGLLPTPLCNSFCLPCTIIGFTDCHRVLAICRDFDPYVWLNLSREGG